MTPPAGFSTGTWRSLQQGPVGQSRAPDWDTAHFWLGKTPEVCRGQRWTWICRVGSGHTDQEELDTVELHPLEPDMGQEGPPRAPCASRTFHPVPDWMAFPKDMVGMGVWGPSCCRLTSWDPQCSSVRRSWERTGKAARKRAWKGSALLPEGPRRRLRCRGHGRGSLCFCLLWITARFGTQYSGFGMGDAGWLLEPEVVGGPVRGSSGTEGTGCFAGVCLASPCPPSVTEPGIHGLGQSFGRRHHWELPLLHPKGNLVF